MTEVFGVLAFALLFSAFGVLRQRSGGGGCGACHGACNGVCEQDERSPVDSGAKGGRA
jgi:hypothetical protein